MKLDKPLPICHGDHGETSLEDLMRKLGLPMTALKLKCQYGEHTTIYEIVREVAKEDSK